MRLELAFDVFGDTQNPPFLILHGFLGSKRNWKPIATALAQHYCVYVLDARNHGHSPCHSLMNYESMCDDVAYFITQKQLNPVIILGHSMGGKIAMCLALTHPHLISHLIVLDIAPRRYPHSFKPLVLTLKTLPIETLKNRKQAEDYLEPFIADLSYRQFLLQNLVLKDGHYEWRIDLSIFHANVDHITDFPLFDSIENAPVFHGLALFIAGAQSNYLLPYDVKPLFPNAQLTVIDDCGHWIHTQQPQQLLAVLTHFLSHD